MQVFKKFDDYYFFAQPGNKCNKSSSLIYHNYISYIEHTKLLRNDLLLHLALVKDLPCHMFILSLLTTVYGIHRHWLCLATKLHEINKMEIICFSTNVGLLSSWRDNEGKGSFSFQMFSKLADYSIKILPPLPNELFLGWIKRHNVTKMGLDVMLPTFGT